MIDVLQIPGGNAGGHLAHLGGAGLGLWYAKNIKRGIDIGSPIEKIINQLKGNHTILVVEHDMAFVRDIAEKITVMHLGKLLAQGDIHEIERDPAVQEAYLGSGGIH